jgi:hypothetical protein
VRYLLLICGDEKRLNELPEAEAADRSQRWAGYTQELIAAEKMCGGERLM